MSNLEIVMGVVLATMAFAAIVLFNTLVNLRNECDRALANIDVLLRQRTDELPNLVEVCKGYRDFERDLLPRVLMARQAAWSARTPAETEHAADLATRAFGSLMAVAEAYPNLKANKSFVMLQRRITGIENEIADRREYFNETVTAWNTRIEQFPDSLVAGLFLRARRRSLLKLSGIARDRVDLAA